MARILIAEPTPALHQLLEQVVTDVGHEPVDAAGACEKLACDALILEPDWPGARRLAECLRHTAPTLPSSIVSLHADRWTAPFWEAARGHRLVAPRCMTCGAFRLPPAPFCWRCRAQDVEWVELSGRGTVYSFTVTRQALNDLKRKR